MGLLDELRQKAAAAREAQQDPAQAKEERANLFRAVALPAMFRIHRVLSELVTQLKVLQEEAPATVNIPQVGEVAGFVQGQYEILSDGMPPETITLRCALRMPRPRPLELRTVGNSITAWVDSMRRQGVHTKVLRLLEATRPNQRAYVGIEGNVPVTLQFKIDVDAGALQLFSRNFDQLSDRRQFFSPASVTSQWCEELLKFVLRKEHRFLQAELSPEVREQLRRRIEWEKLQEQGAGAALDVRNVSLKTLFKRTPQLKLQHAGQTWELTTHQRPFTLGRVADCDLQVRELRVSRFHARIELRDEQFHLIDDSTNGTYVRFDGGRTAALKKSSLVLEGSGLIGLGSAATADNPDAIRFSM